jgi:hypothetical protein
MAWAKLENPKPPSNSAVPPMVVKVTARELKTKNGVARYIKIKIGYQLAEKARLIQKEHGVHVLQGTAADAGKLAVSMDDATGKFKAKRRRDGSYEIAIGAAAARKFALTFPPFSATGAILQLPALPPTITFDVTPEFLGH